MTSNKYIMDTSSLVELNRHNPIDVFPSVWNNLESLSKKGLLVAPYEVLSEVKERDDELASWAKRNNKIFRPPTKKQIEILKDILKNYPALVKEDRKYDADASSSSLSFTSESTSAGATRKPFLESDSKLFHTLGNTSIGLCLLRCSG